MVYRVNIFPSTNFTNGLYRSGTIESSISNGTLTLSNAQGDSYMAINIPVDANKEYTFGVDLDLQDVTTSNSFQITDLNDWTYFAGNSDTTSGRKTVTFTTKNTTSQVRIQFYCANGIRKFSKPLLESSATYDPNLPFFDYSTMPFNSGN